MKAALDLALGADRAISVQHAAPDVLAVLCKPGRFGADLSLSREFGMRMQLRMCAYCASRAVSVRISVSGMQLRMYCTNRAVSAFGVDFGHGPRFVLS